MSDSIRPILDRLVGSAIPGHPNYIPPKPEPKPQPIRVFRAPWDAFKTGE